MNYELAKELKDAGFPMPTILGQAYKPDLSQLMEACGNDDRGFSLSRILGQWTAQTPKGEIEDWEQKVGKGSTPEEAVARLWLSLNT